MSEKETNVLIIAYNDLNNSGVPNVIYQVIKSLNDKCNFDVVVFGNDDYYYQRLLAEGIKINLITFSDFKSKSSILKKLWNHFFRLSSYYRQAKLLLKQKNYDIVHSFKEYDSWPFLKAGHKIGVKKLIVHGTVTHEKKNGAFLNYLYKRNRRLTMKYGNTFVGVSEHSCKSTFGSKPFIVIYNSYDEKKYNNSINLLNEDELVITQVATYNSNKNQLFSISVINEIRKIYPKCRLNLIGKETEKGYLNKMYDLINTDSISNYVKIIDGSENISEYLKHTTFSIIASKREGASITAIESQACGVKVFASNNVSKEMNAGGMIFLDLNCGPKNWAKKILEEFSEVKNTREKYDVSKHSLSSFKNTISAIYGLNYCNKIN